MSHAQCVGFLGAMRSPVYRGVLAVMYGSGLRIGEAVKLTVGDVEVEVPRQLTSYHLGGRDAWRRLETLELA